MKKILIVCLLAYATNVVAQKKTTDVDELIKAKNFTFVVTEVKRAGGVRNTNPPNPVPQNVNAAAITMAKRQQITTTPIVGAGEYVRGLYGQVDRLDAAYSPILNKTNTNITSDQYVIYLIQGNEQIILTAVQNPSDISKIKTADYNTISATRYTLKAVKKNNGKWTLIYQIKEGSKNQTFYLDVSPDGVAKLTTDATTILAGYVLPSTS